jgi:hypothetical protein
MSARAMQEEGLSNNHGRSKLRNMTHKRMSARAMQEEGLSNNHGRSLLMRKVLALSTDRVLEGLDVRGKRCNVVEDCT